LTPSRQRARPASWGLPVRSTSFALVVALGASPLLLTSSATAGPLHLKSGSSVKTDGGSDLRLPPGYFLTEPDWSKLDAELRRLQNAETRLDAENKSMRKSLDDGPGWGTLIITVTAFAAGVGITFAL
jgi:hypothetical protein